MKITIKTLQGKAFSVEVESPDTTTIATVKDLIAASQTDMPAAGQKLIHAGKVLKDDDLVMAAGVTEASFLVCMMTKKPPTRAAAPAVAAPAPVPVPAPTTLAATSSPSTDTTSSTTVTETTSSTTTSSDAAAATTSPAVETSAAAATLPAPASVVVPSESSAASAASVSSLCDMGFPEDQVLAALAAAFNNPDRAVEYLMNGIPEQLMGVVAPASAAPSASTANANATSVSSLEELRNDPQFEALRALVQANPSALPQVLQTIGTTRPHLMALIHANHEAFVQMLNEPLATSTATPSTTAAAAPSLAFPTASGVVTAPGSTLSGSEAASSPHAMLQALASLPPAQQAAMATSMGLTAEQFAQFHQMMSTMSPEALTQMMGSLGGAGGPTPNGGAPGSGLPGQTTIQLTQEEAAAVDRLVSMGFSRQDVLQAYLACEKNEGLAANFLMDSMMDDQ